MYDNIKLRLPLTHDMPDITQRLTDINTNVNGDGEVTFSRGRLDNLTVYVGSGYIYIKGSIAAYFNDGNNIYPLTRYDAAKAIEKLSDALGVNVGEADITALEIGATFNMANPIAQYFAVLGDLKGYQRTIKGKDTLYYDQGIKRPYRQIYFYNKEAECRQAGKDIPGGLEDANLLKYEIRLMNSLCKQMGVPSATAQMLGDAGFYRKAAMLWRSEYDRIQKVLQLDFEASGTAGECFEAIAGYLMNEAGDKMEWLLSSAISSANLSRDKISRLKAKIRHAKSMGKLGQKGELLWELNECILNEVAYL